MIEKHFKILGHKVRDRVTGLEGLATSLSFDLYGCIQVVVSPPLKKDGTQPDGSWFDISRLKVLSSKPVMPPPNFINPGIPNGEKGGADKPLP